jgi:tRNA nucleotidyltransferase (CCA-adding enzyme)
VRIDLPLYVRRALSALEGAGFAAFVAGGCVRDAALGIEPRDWDICASAAPEETAAVFAGHKILETGARYGTLTVTIDGEKAEITTFRADGGYSDGRRPDSVEFVRDIETDLSRRDFTMNAMAYNRELVDPFGGMRDIGAKLIRCVGDPDARFREDALRIMRAARFASETGFSMEEKTRDALFRRAPLVKKVSAERIAAELNRLLLGKNADAALTEYREVLIQAAPLFPAEELPPLSGAPKDLTARLALLLGGLGEGGAREFLRALKYPRSVIREVSFRVSRGDVLGKLPTIGELAVRGGDMAEAGLSGREIGEAKRALLALVAEGKLPNERGALLRRARELAASKKLLTRRSGRDIIIEQ